MALKPDRFIQLTDIRYVCDAAANAGDMTVYNTAGSGGLVSQLARPSVTRVANPSGYKPAGALLHDVFASSTLDETQFHRNFHKYVQKVGEACEIVKKGSFTTDRFIGTPTAGDTAYLSSSGTYTSTRHATGGIVATPIVGEFEGAVDEDGYISVRVELPGKV